MDASLTTLFHTKLKLILSPLAYISNIMVCMTQTLPQIISHKLTGHIQKHFITSYLTYVTNVIQDFTFVKCCIESLLHLDLSPDNMLFGGLQIVTLLRFPGYIVEKNIT